MRRFLDRLYLVSGAIGAVFVALICVLMVAQSIGRELGLRTGAITAACDRVEVTLTGPGGHTARPQLTVDLVHAMGRVVTEVPGLLSRLVDPRSALSVV